MIMPKPFGILERLGQTIGTSSAIEVVKIRPATTLLRTHERPRLPRRGGPRPWWWPFEEFVDIVTRAAWTALAVRRAVPSNRPPDDRFHRYLVIEYALPSSDNIVASTAVSRRHDTIHQSSFVWDGTHHLSSPAAVVCSCGCGFSTDLCEVLGFVSLTLMTGTQSSLLLQTPPRDLHDFFKKANRGLPTKSHG
jgi:hypothetical protein